MLTLYFKNTCQYCHKVMDFAEAAGINLELKDLYADPENRNDLVARGGKGQVPYLADSDRRVEMYESEDIIDYLKENYAS